MGKHLGFNTHGVLEWRADPPNITAGAAALQQYHFRVRDDTAGLNVNSGWLALEDTNPSASIGAGTDNRFRIRFTIDEYVDKVVTVTTPTLYVSRNSGGYTAVTGSSSYVQATLSSQYADNAACSTQLLGNGTVGAWDNGGTADEVDGAIGSVTLGNKGAWFECEFCVYLIDEADSSEGDTFDFQVQAANIDTWTAVPQVTLTLTSPPTTYDRELSDDLTLTENQVRTVTNDRTLSDSLTLTDTLIPVAVKQRYLSDSLTLAETLSRTAVYTREPYAGLNLTESLTRIAINTRVLSENLTLSEAIIRDLTNVRVLTDDLTFADSLARQVIAAAVPGLPTYGLWRRAGRM